MHTINEQDGFIVSGFTFQPVVSLYEQLLGFSAELMGYANRFFVAELMAVQP